MNRRKQPRPPPHVSAATAMLADAEFAGREWNVGETLPSPPPPQQQQLPPTPTIPPPDWQPERDQQAAGEQGPDRPGGGAVGEMLAAARERGELEERPGPGVPMHSEPLERFVPDEPDWRAEQREAEARQAQERLDQARKLLGEPERSLDEYPAKPAPSKAPAAQATTLRVQLPPPPWAEANKEER